MVTQRRSKQMRFFFLLFVYAVEGNMLRKVEFIVILRLTASLFLSSSYFILPKDDAKQYTQTDTRKRTNFVNHRFVCLPDAIVVLIVGFFNRLKSVRTRFVCDHHLAFV